MSLESRRIAMLLPALFLLAGCARDDAGVADPAPILEGMGDYHRKVSTTVPLAQRLFDQGMVLAYGFNHAEAERSFRHAAALDPECGPCWWGAALVNGPNINAPEMDPDLVPRTWEALQNALALTGRMDEREAALVEALSARYGPEPVEDRTALDEAYAAAMAAVYERFPDDADIAALFAESLMDLHPWDYWLRDGTPQPWTPGILEVLERVLEHAPDHPGANHFYIHAVEASTRPERATAAADRLSRLVPGAGHLVHMPSHIYIRIGRYHDGSEANVRAIASDHDYITQCRQQGIYPVAYHPHNHHMLWATASFEGRREVSMKAARETAAHVDAALFDVPGVGGAQQHFRTIPYFGMVRFGMWDEMLAEPSPGETAYPRGVWHYGRGMAYAARGELDAAGAELAALSALVADESLDEVRIWEINSVRTILGIAQGVLEGELAFRAGDVDRAIDRLERAAAVEAELVYGEPPDWFYPVRHVLGDVLLEAGRPEQAERVYRDDLARFPANGWSLAGLMRALRAQGRHEEAAAVEAEFDEAWQWADVEIDRSRI